MQIWLEHWVRLVMRKVVRDERGQGEIIIIALLIFLIYLLSTGRRVLVQ